MPSIAPKSRTVSMADPFFTDADRKFIHEALDAILSAALSMGPHVAAFEKEFAAKMGVPFAIAVNACTSALEISLKILGLQPGDEVVVPSETFSATGMAVVLAGGVPVLSEISPDTFCLDLDDMARRVTPRTKGVITVHFGGCVDPNIERLRRLCDDKGLFLIEDVAHAPGARRYGRMAGAFGHTGCFSFFPTKVLTSGEGGMLITCDERLAKLARSYQHRGRDMEAAGELYVRDGRNVRMTEIAAVLGRVQLGHLDEYLRERRRVAAIYQTRLAAERRLRLIMPDDPEASAFWKVPVLMPQGTDRAAVTAALKAEGVSVDWAYDPPLHRQPFFERHIPAGARHLPITDDLLSRHLCLPCHPRISDEDAHYVIDSLIKVLDRNST